MADKRASRASAAFKTPARSQRKSGASAVGKPEMVAKRRNLHGAEKSAEESSREKVPQRRPARNAADKRHLGESPSTIREEVPRELRLALPFAFQQSAGCNRCGPAFPGEEANTFCHWSCRRLHENGVAHVNSDTAPQALSAMDETPDAASRNSITSTPVKSAKLVADGSLDAALRNTTPPQRRHDSETPVAADGGSLRVATVRGYAPGPPVLAAIAADAPVGADPEEWPSWLGGKLAALVDLAAEGPVVVVTVRAPDIARALTAMGVKVLAAVGKSRSRMAISLFPDAAPILVSTEAVSDIAQAHVFIDALPDSAAVASVATVELRPNVPVCTEPRVRRGKKRCANERFALEREAYAAALKAVGVRPRDWYDQSEAEEPATRQEAWLRALRAWAARMSRGGQQPSAWPPSDVPQAFCSGLTVEQTLENELLAISLTRDEVGGLSGDDASRGSDTLCLFCRRPVILARDRQLSIAEALVAKGASPEPAGELAGIFCCAVCPRAMHSKCRERWSAGLQIFIGPDAGRADVCPQHECQLCAAGQVDIACVSCPFAGCWECVEAGTANPWKEFAFLGWVGSPLGAAHVRCPACTRLGLRAIRDQTPKRLVGRFWI